MSEPYAPNGTVWTTYAYNALGRTTIRNRGCPVDIPAGRAGKFGGRCVMIVEAKEYIAAAAETIFAFSQDYRTRVAWDPFLREATLLGSDCAGVGARSWCVAWFGLGMESEYVSYQPPRTAAVKMTKGPWMFTQFAASWNFHALAARKTEVRFLYSFRLRPLLRPLTFLVGACMRYEMKRRLRALKKACE